MESPVLLCQVEVVSDVNFFRDVGIVMDGWLVAEDFHSPRYLAIEHGCDG